MVQLSLVKSSNAALVSSQPLVAVFIGGNSGIGALTLLSLAETHGKEGKGLRAYILGRTAKAAEDIIAECQQLCPTGQFRFLKTGDLALMKDVDIACTEFMKLEEKEAKAIGQTPRIDILIMSQAIFKPWDPRKETSEGLDTFMSLLYYSRMRFITRLLPLLLASELPAHVTSVYGPGRDSNFVSDDLSLRDPKNYGFGNSGSHAAYFTTFFMEYLAAQHPGKLALTHCMPGLIYADKITGPGFNDPSFPFWFRAIFKYGAPLIKLLPPALNQKECGARILFSTSSRFPARASDEKAVKSVGGVGVAESSDGIVGGGAYRVNYNSEPVATGKQYKKMREDGWLEKCVKHTLDAWEEIEAGRKFSG